VKQFISEQRSGFDVYKDCTHIGSSFISTANLRDGTSVGLIDYSVNNKDI